MKKISVLIPTFNEQDNIIPLTEEITNIFRNKLKRYDYEIVFIDNCSTDDTRKNIEKLCYKNKKIKAIYNVKNFGYLRSPFYGLQQTTGDCTILMAADFQDPPELIMDFVKEWEKGYKIVAGIKNRSKENFILYFFRTLFYKIIKKITDIEHIEHFTGFGLYDKRFINILKKLDEVKPYLRGIVAELGFKRKDILYEQNRRRSGKTKSNWWSLYDLAMLGITSYSKVVLRLATIFGFIIAIISFFLAIIYVILKLVFWFAFPIGIAPIIILILFFGAIQLFFIGFLGEYILNINTRIIKRPLVIEEKRINF